MNRILPLTMVLVGIICGIAVAADGVAANYFIPMAAAGTLATLIRLRPIDF